MNTDLRKSIVSKALSDWKNLGSSSHRVSVMISFLTLWPEIEVLLNEDWPIRRIWRMYTGTGRIDCDYSSFRRHIRRQLRIERKMAAIHPDNPDKKPDAVSQASLGQNTAINQNSSSVGMDEVKRPRLPKVDYEKFDLSGKGRKIGFTAEERRNLKLF
jgi:hypothetical protein